MIKITLIFMLALFLFWQPVKAVEVHSVYLPIVTQPYEIAIDCIDGNGRLMECPNE